MHFTCGFVYFNCFILVKFPFKTFKLLIDGYSGSVPLSVSGMEVMVVKPDQNPRRLQRIRADSIELKRDEVWVINLILVWISASDTVLIQVSTCHPLKKKFIYHRGTVKGIFKCVGKNHIKRDTVYDQEKLDSKSQRISVL